MEVNKIYQHNVQQAWPIGDKSVHCIVTSPPYWGLRDYKTEGQMGQEKTPEEFIANMVNVFREGWRVLRDDGTLWINIGDSYCHTRSAGGLKTKDLVGVPWMLAFALRADGWYLRQDIIWHKPNGMPESTTDRCTRCHEYLFMFSKMDKYYYNHEAIKTPVAESSINRYKQDIENQVGSDRQPGKSNGAMKAVGGPSGANKRSVWTVATAGYKEAHFATFPEELVQDPIRAGCPPCGTVLDPFMGSGTTALVALKNGRNYLGLEINGDYLAMAERRLLSVQLGSGII